MQALTLRECQQEALKVLIRFDQICKKNNFKYFLIYGTLIGAIRHNGFIPWDDDLDVMMPREDFDKFVSYSKNHSEDLMPFKLCDRSNTDNYYYGIPRFCNMQFKYVLKHKRIRPFDIGAFIDIYPLDNFCNDEIKGQELYCYCNSLNEWYTRYSNPLSVCWWRNIIKPFLYIYIRIRKGSKYGLRIDDEIRDYILKNTSKEDKFVGLVAWVDGFMQFEKNKMFSLELINHKFEGHLFPVPKCYDYILKKLYGNYMELPPESLRIPHHDYELYKRL